MSMKNTTLKFMSLMVGVAAVCWLSCGTGMDDTAPSGSPGPGSPGEQGPTGPQGEPGPAGPAGAAPFDLVGSDAVLHGTVFADAFSSNSSLQLQTAGTTRIFVDDTTGDVGIGTDSPEADLHVKDTHATAILETTDHTSGSSLILRGNSSTLGRVEFQDSNGDKRGELAYSSISNAIGLTAGSTSLVILAGFNSFGFNRLPLANTMELEGTASKSVAGSWLANSDAAIKTEVETVSKALETLDRVRLVRFRYSDGYRAAHPCIEDRPYLNVIAQEFQEVFPGYVQSSGEQLPDGREILQVDPYPLIIYSAAAAQELHRRLKAQDAEITTLQQKDEAHQRRIADLETRLTTMERLLRQ